MLHQVEFQRLIIEATNRCNLDCSICIRQSWDNSLGSLSKEVFTKLLSDLGEIYPQPNVLFGGYGEPLSHPNILEMIRQLTDIGCQTALITNGTLLTSDLVRSLVESGLEKLWISIDNFHRQAIKSDSSELPRLGLFEQLTEILNSGNGNLAELNPGLSMVLARENQAELLSDIDQAQQLGIRSFFITNLEAYTPAQVENLPYNLKQLRQPGAWRVVNAQLIKRLESISSNNPGVSIDGILTNHQDKCPFAVRGDLVLRWDGALYPCLPLLYDRTTYIGSWEHKQYNYSCANILDRSITDIWTDVEFDRLRERLLDKEFSPCLSCRDCWLSEDNRQDCMFNEHPTCGGCLWAAGLISCP